jgi:hypothetical protein
MTQAMRGPAMVGAVTVLALAIVASATSPGAVDGGGRVTGARGLASLPVAARGPVSAAIGRRGQTYRVVALRAWNPEQHLGATSHAPA